MAIIQQFLLLLHIDFCVLMPKERNKADDYREKAYISSPFAYAASPFDGDAQRY